MIQWTIPQFLKLTEQELVKNFTKAGIYTTSKMRGYLNVAQAYKRYDGKTRYRGLDPSKPGQFPKKLSGQLQKSITWEVDNKNMTLTVGSNLAGYPSFLETGTRFMKPRPWLTLTLDREKGTIGRLITTGK